MPTEVAAVLHGAASQERHKTRCQGYRWLMTYFSQQRSSAWLNSVIHLHLHHHHHHHRHHHHGHDHQWVMTGHIFCKLLRFKTKLFPMPWTSLWTQVAQETTLRTDGAEPWLYQPENYTPVAKHGMGTLLFRRGATCANGGKCCVFWLGFPEGNMHHLKGPTIRPPVGFPVVAAINMTRRMACMCFLNGMFGPRISNTMAMFFF